MPVELTSQVVQMLKTLGYNRLWLDYGVLTVEDLAIQYVNLNTGEDTNLEHYRYGTFRRYLIARPTLTDIELTDYLRLLIAEPDRIMADAAAADLLKLLKLTNSQFEKACEVINSVENRLTKFIARWKLLRKLQNKQPSKQLFAACMREGDRIVQEHLIGVASTTQLQHLSKFGITKKIRAVAAEKLHASFS